MNGSLNLCYVYILKAMWLMPDTYVKFKADFKN